MIYKLGLDLPARDEVEYSIAVRQVKDLFEIAVTVTYEDITVETLLPFGPYPTQAWAEHVMELDRLRLEYAGYFRLAMYLYELVHDMVANGWLSTTDGVHLTHRVPMAHQGKYTNMIIEMIRLIPDDEPFNPYPDEFPPNDEIPTEKESQD